MKTLRIHKIMNKTVANGPGTRVGIWVQGCTLACRGCFNPGTHPRAGMTVTVEELIGTLRTFAQDKSIEGITFSGGEPLQQWACLREILTWIKRETRWSVVIFTGYTPEEIAQFSLSDELADLSDAVIAGRYEQENRQAKRLIGSSNKVLMLHGRYTEKDFSSIPEAEIRIGRDGTLTLTGINPATFGSAG